MAECGAVLSLFASLLLAAQPPVTIAVPGMATTGLEAAIGDAVFERFATVLGQTPGLKVSTARDLQQTLGLERQRELMGCDTRGSSCLAELAGSLGVDAIISASLAKVGTRYLTTVRALRARDGAEVASASGRLADLDEVSAWLDTQAPLLGEKVLLAFGRTPGAAAPQSAGFVRFLPGLLGLAAGGTGAGLLVVAGGHRASLQAASVPAGDISSTAQAGQTFETAGAVLTGVGAAGVVASVVWLLAAPAASTTAMVVPSPGGATVSIGGTFP